MLSIADDGCEQCRESNDLMINAKCQAPHLADLITGTFLPEQYKVTLYKVISFRELTRYFQDMHYLRQLQTMLEEMTGPGTSPAERVHHELFFDKEIIKN